MISLRRRAFTSSLAPFALLALPGCFVGRTSENEPLRMDVVDKLRPGVTTSADVVALLGAPTDIVQLGKRSAYLYQHALEKSAGLLLIVVGLFNEDRCHDRMWVFFDENGVLTHFGATLASHRAHYAMPWNTLHTSEDDREADEARRRAEAADKPPSP